MNAPAPGREADFFRKLVFGERAGTPEASYAPAPHRGVASTAGGLPGGVSGGEDFGQHEGENP
jgi:hypothetical protein